MRRTKRSTAGNRYEQVIAEEQTRAELGATLSEELQEELGVFAVQEDADDKEFTVTKSGIVQNEYDDNKKLSKRKVRDVNAAGCSKDLNAQNSGKLDDKLDGNQSDDHSSEYSTDSSDFTESDSSDGGKGVNCKRKKTTRKRRKDPIDKEFDEKRRERKRRKKELEAKQSDIPNYKLNYAQDYLSETSDVEHEEKAEKTQKQKVKQQEAEKRNVAAQATGSLRRSSRNSGFTITQAKKSNPAVLKNAQTPERRPETPNSTSTEKPLETVINSRRRSARKVKPNETAENEPERIAESRSYAVAKACKVNTRKTKKVEGGEDEEPFMKKEEHDQTEDTYTNVNAKNSEKEFEKEDTSSDSDSLEGERSLGKLVGKGKNKKTISKSQTQPHKSIHFTQQELFETAKQQEIENEKSLQILLEQQRESALKRKAGYNKKKNKQPGNYIKYVSKIVEESIPKKNNKKSIEVILPKGAEYVQNTITNYTVS